MFGLRWCYNGGGGQALFATAPIGLLSSSSSSSSPRIPAHLRSWTRTFVLNSNGGRRWTAEPESRSSSVRSPDQVELEYADLNLKDKYGGGHVGHVRIRQHVNPLSSSFAVPVPMPDWKRVYKDPMLPLMVDIGSVDSTCTVLGGRPGSKKHLFLVCKCHSVFCANGVDLPWTSNICFYTVSRPSFQEKASQKKTFTKALGRYYIRKSKYRRTGFSAIGRGWSSS